VEVGFGGRSDSDVVVVEALIDGGASNSFLDLHSLNENLRKRIEQFKVDNVSQGDLKLTKMKLLISGATSAVHDVCVIAEVNLKIGSWQTKHKLIITDKIIGKRLILGRDFLKANGVVIDHAIDKLAVRGPSGGLQELGDPRQSCAVNTTVVIKPWVEQVVKCKTDRVNTKFVFEPTKSNETLSWANALVETDNNGEFFISCINLGSKPIQMERGEEVGTCCFSYQIIKGSESVELKSVMVSEQMLEKLNKIQFGEKLDERQKDQLKKLVMSNLEAFQWSDDDVGRTDLISHQIDTGNAKPIRQKQYRIPLALHGELDKQIKELLKTDMIEPSNSPWCSPIMIVKQTSREGVVKHRFIADMTKVNDVTVKDAYPLQRIDEALDQLGGNSYFSVIDMAKGYFQVPLDEKDREKNRIHC
jgi:hypothetical protein